MAKIIPGQWTKIYYYKEKKTNRLIDFPVTMDDQGHL